MLRSALLCLLSIGAASIGHAQAPKVRDSAGVHIVENGARAKAPVVFTLGDKPSLDVGGLESDPDVEFSPTQGFLRGTFLSDGGLAVIDSVRVHLFDKTGKRLKIVGRQGKGPEEFTSISSICRTRRDTLVIGDRNARRVAVLTGDGSVVRTFLQDTLGSASFSSCLDDGTIVLGRLMSSAPGSPGTRRLTRVRLDGTVVNSIGEFDTGVFDLVTLGTPTVAAQGQSIYWADNRSSEVRVYSVTGTLERIVRSADVGDSITSEDVERRVRSTMPKNTPPAQVTARVDRMRSMPHASHWPTYHEILVDPRGRLWVQDYVKSLPSPDGWTQFDEQGRLVGRLVIPAPPEGQRAMHVIAFGTNEVLIRRTDDDGRAHLTVYPLVRAR